jgi:hypothetical protein
MDPEGQNGASRLMLELIREIYKLIKTESVDGKITVDSTTLSVLLSGTHGLLLENRRLQLIIDHQAFGERVNEVAAIEHQNGLCSQFIKELLGADDTPAHVKEKTIALVDRIATL